VINYADSDIRVQALIRSIKNQLEPIRSFSPYWDPAKRKTVDPHDLTAAPHLPSEIFSRKSLGPYLEIYRIKNA
jgi:hypothetical protein